MMATTQPGGREGRALALHPLACVCAIISHTMEAPASPYLPRSPTPAWHLAFGVVGGQHGPMCLTHHRQRRAHPVQACGGCYCQLPCCQGSGVLAVVAASARRTSPPSALLTSLVLTPWVSMLHSVSHVVTIVCVLHFLLHNIGLCY